MEVADENIEVADLALFRGRVEKALYYTKEGEYFKKEL